MSQDFITQQENDISKALNVSNPTLLKTGVLGYLVNSLAAIKTDNTYYLKYAMNESSPATANNYENLFFHSSNRRIPIEFSKPATMTASIIIPELFPNDGEVITYTVPRNVELKDENNFKYTLEETIEIYVSSGSVKAKSHGRKIQNLEVYRHRDPNDSTKYIYLVNIQIQQYERKFQIVRVPESLSPDDPLIINMDIPNKRNIYQLNAWRQTQDKTLNSDLTLQTVKNYDTPEITSAFELTPLDVKFTKNLSNQTDEHIFVKFNETGVLFTTGDGIYGRRPRAGEFILIEIKLTEGSRGNIQTADFRVNGVQLTRTTPAGVVEAQETKLPMVGLQGASGGRDLEDKESIRRKILNDEGDYIGTLNAIRSEWTLDNGEPFLDKKYFNSNHNIFVYNILRDKNNNIVPSTTLNIKEEDLEANPFFPEYTYAGVDLISPFFYIKKNDRFQANLVLPEVYIPIIPTPGTPDVIKLENDPQLYLTYDWMERDTYLELRDVNRSYNYNMSCNIDTELVFNQGNNFRIQVNKLFLNSWCLFDGLPKIGYDPDLGDVRVPGYLADVRITCSNQDGNKVITFLQAEEQEYIQIKPKQNNYNWIDIDLFDTTKETKYILNIPYLDKEYVLNNMKENSHKLDNFFKVEDVKGRVATNILITQSFYNTIKLEPIYRNYILSTLDVFVEPKNNLNIDLLLSKLNLTRSEWKSASKVEMEVAWLIQDYLDGIEGYNLKFNESLLESKIIEFLNREYQVAENVKIWNPSGPIRVRNSAQVYSLMEDNFGTGDAGLTPEELQEKVDRGEFPQLSQKQIVDFVPPYFSFGRVQDNITIKLS